MRKQYSTVHILYIVGKPFEWIFSLLGISYSSKVEHVHPTFSWLRLLDKETHVETRPSFFGGFHGGKTTMILRVLRDRLLGFFDGEGGADAELAADPLLDVVHQYPVTWWWAFWDLFFLGPPGT